MSGRLIFLGSIFFVLTVLAVYLYRRIKNHKTFFICIGAAIMIPIVNAIISCQISHISEACVWNKALLLFTVPFSLLAIAPSVYLVITGAQLIYKRRSYAKSA